MAGLGTFVSSCNLDNQQHLLNKGKLSNKDGVGAYDRHTCMITKISRWLFGFVTR